MLIHLQIFGASTLHLSNLRSCSLDGEVLKEMPEDVFIRKVVKDFITLFLRSCIDNKEQVSSLPHDYIVFVEHRSAEEVKQFYNILVKEYLNETKMFYQPLDSKGFTTKQRKRKLKKNNTELCKTIFRKLHMREQPVQ
jgi:hypothetical protein